ncbi:GIY-YIG nuclease family protein [Candidatus Puniceispirillum sp.]|nr:GIY-YIG nuclease family protein [Candidatus Puniceispirillum sp.]
MSKEFFQPEPYFNPRIYAYSDSHQQYAGLYKIGYTTRTVKDRVNQQYPIITPGKPTYTIHLDESAVCNDGSSFTDKDVHRYLLNKGFLNPSGEWFKCNIDDVRSALISIKTGKLSSEKRSNSFEMRPEQEAAVEKTAVFFNSYNEDEGDAIPHFLWNAKMRFGKTFASYQLAVKMGWKKVLVLTFKPAVQSAWEEDLLTHTDFSGWQFISRDGLSFKDVDKSKPFVCFGSFQDFLGKNNVGGIKQKNEWAHTTHWDCVIFDEYHYGAWRESAKELFEAEDKKEVTAQEGEGIDFFEEDILPITTNHYLYLSGTPFRAIESGEFIEEQIFNWTYSDEQKAKQEWLGGDNPYASLPRMVLMTYQLPDSIREVALDGEFDEFDLNLFFSAKGEGKDAKFVYESEVQKWLDLIRGQYLPTTKNNLKLGAKKPPLPFSDSRLLRLLNHTFWFLPTVASCHAMKNLQNQNLFFHDYNIVVAAGNKAGLGVKALEPVKLAMDNPLETKTITLSCGKLATGVSVKPWTGILMLRNSSSPETYFQAAFRVQTPWEIQNPDGLSPNKKEILKHECYVFDFAPNRALRQIADYSCRLNIDGNNPEKKVEEFIKFLPVLAYDGSSMKEIDAAGILDMAMSGTSATLLARRWESALLVNVDNMTLARLMKNEKAMLALMNIEGFRSLNNDIETIINKSDSVKKAKEKANEDELTWKEKKKITEEEKEYKSLRKQIQEKLIKFATRIPVFMYLTDYRERSLKDVITQLEPGLFKKVTGLSVEDFDLLVSLNVFNSSLMNDAVYKFKRYEDASLSYTGINKHTDEDVGLFDTTISSAEFVEQL